MTMSKQNKNRVVRIYEHRELTKKQRRQPFYYSRWFKCFNVACKTTLVMPDQCRVWNASGDKRAALERWIGKRNEQRRAEREVERQVSAGELVLWGDAWPEGERATTRTTTVQLGEVTSDEDTAALSIKSGGESDERPPWE
jgi:hypothetical protein